MAGFDALLKEPPFHTIVLPALVPVNVILVAEQVMVFVLADAVSVGKIVLVVIDIILLVLQPVIVFVAVAV